MMVKPKVRHNLCLNINPTGCESYVRQQVEAVKKLGPIADGPRRVLILGGSEGYGLASKSVATFAAGADTVSVSYERVPNEKHDGSPGWYMNDQFEQLAHAEGRKAVSIVGDAFSDEIKAKTLAAVGETLGQVDLVIYSIASRMRTDPVSGELYRSSIKPTGETYNGAVLDIMSGGISEVEIDPATDEEVRQTVKVMGGEDWQLWIEALAEQNLLAPGAATVAYSYIGPVHTKRIYRRGTLGRAKQHLEATARNLDERLRSICDGRAFVSVNKALVTRASAVIPGMAGYVAALYRVMKNRGLQEGCMEQVYRLFNQRLYPDARALAEDRVLVDGDGRIRVDDWEMRDDVQAEVSKILAHVNEKNLFELTDFEGYRDEFFDIHGFLQGTRTSGVA
jgi:enoyl-[acyl-carrier protein] reductase / trans-2-enoyl-CoA reductase (NAD+)